MEMHLQIAMKTEQMSECTNTEIGVENNHKSQFQCLWGV